jgi:hypothetical protein
MGPYRSLVLIKFIDPFGYPQLVVIVASPVKHQFNVSFVVSRPTLWPIVYNYHDLFRVFVLNKDSTVDRVVVSRGSALDIILRDRPLECPLDETQYIGICIK